MIGIQHLKDVIIMEEEKFSLLKKLRGSFKRRCEKMKIYNKEAFKSEKKLPWNIYGAKTLGEGLSKFKFIHYFFKYKFFVPLLWITKKMLGKYLDEPVPDEEYNKNIDIFNKSFNLSVDQFVRIYMTDTNIEGEALKKELERQHGCDSVALLHLMKKLVTMMAVNDTAYREFLNMLMHSIAQLMLKEYGGKKVNHLIYNSSDVYDINYVLMLHKIKDMEEVKNGENEKGSTEDK